MSRHALIAAIVLLALAGALYLAGEVRETLARIRSLSWCEDNGLGAWGQVLSAFAAENADRLPTAAERKTLARRYRRLSSHYQFTCDTGAPYEWSPTPLRVGRGAIAVAWCGRPHGHRRPWRNVLFDDLSLRRVDGVAPPSPFATPRQSPAHLAEPAPAGAASQPILKPPPPPSRGR
jgi:hypothetical protein